MISHQNSCQLRVNPFQLSLYDIGQRDTQGVENPLSQLQSRVGFPSSRCFVLS